MINQTNESQTGYLDLIAPRLEKLTVPPFGEITMMLFGEPKAGKTRFASGNPGAFFYSTEPGQDYITSPMLYVDDDVLKAKGVRYHWQVFQIFVREMYLKKKNGMLCKYGINNVVIDIVDNLYAQCLTYICGQKNIAYPPENDFGKTWKEIRDEWEAWLRHLMGIVNVTFITHCGETKVEICQGGLTKEVTRWQPTFKGNKAAQYLDGVVNAVGHVRKDAAGKYTVSFRGAPNTAAGDRTGILDSLGELDLFWNVVATAYESKARDNGLEVKSRWS